MQTYFLIIQARVNPWYWLWKYEGTKHHGCAGSNVQDHCCTVCVLITVQSVHILTVTPQVNLEKLKRVTVSPTAWNNYVSYQGVFRSFVMLSPLSLCLLARWLAETINSPPSKLLLTLCCKCHSGSGSLHQWRFTEVTDSVRMDWCQSLSGTCHKLCPFLSLSLTLTLSLSLSLSLPFLS